MSTASTIPIRFVCELALGYNPGDSAPVYTDVSAYLRGFHITRGRQYELNQFQAGTCDITLKNLNRAFDPTYASSPYYPNLRPMVPVRLRVAKAIPTDATLTVSGNEITDAVRTTNTQGDGRTPPDSSFGIYEQRANLCTNGGFETDLSGWSMVAGTAVLTQDGTQFKFGSKSAKVVTTTASNFLYSPVTVSPSTTYTFSVWIYSAAGGEVLTVRWNEFISGVFSVTKNTANITLPAGWSRQTLTATTNASVTRIDPHVSTPNGSTLYFDGAMVNAGPVALPYCEGTIPAGRVQAPASLLSATQGWVAMRVRMGFASTTPPGVAPTFFHIADASPLKELRLDFDAGYGGASNRWAMRRGNVSVETALFGNVSWAAGDMLTIIGKWTATSVGISIGGAAFVNQTTINAVPVIASSVAEIGSYYDGSRKIDSDVLWFACGTGTLTDADAQTIYAMPNAPAQTNSYWSNDASYLLWPDNSKVTAVWQADTSTYRIPADAYLFTGYVERFPQNRTGPTYAETQVQAVDGFELLTNAVLPADSYPQELSGARVSRVLDAVNWSASARSISTGQSQIIAYTFGNANFVQPLSHLQDVATSELGGFFMAKDGKATFRDRYSSLSTTSLGTFTDQPIVDTSSIGYSDLQKSLDKDLIFNDWRGTRSGGSSIQQAIDSISITQYNQRAQSRTPLLPDDLSVYNQMSSLNSAYAQPSMRVSQITVTPGDNAAAWLQVLARDLGDKITAREHPPGGGIPFVQDSLIQQIDLSVDKHSVSAKCVYSLLQADPNSYLILNHATSGTLDGANKLGY